MFLRRLKKFGPIKAATIITVFFVVIACLISYVTVYLMDGAVETKKMLLPLFLPILTFYGPAIYFLKLMIRLDSAEKQLKQKNTELEKALKEVKILEGLFPICSSCKSIRDEEGQWNAVERYIEKKSDATFSHSLCPYCFAKLYPMIKKNGSSE
ncbi:MAG: hypothetical protein JXR69_04325 [Candidatus Delongbacteria bacterium]|nr:hypothetical protein [Candidatus Delongbacteria bacterium]